MTSDAMLVLNAGLLAASILGTADENIAAQLDAFKTNMASEVIAKAVALKQQGWDNGFD